MSFLRLHQDCHVFSRLLPGLGRLINFLTSSGVPLIRDHPFYGRAVETEIVQASKSEKKIESEGDDEDEEGKEAYHQRHSKEAWVSVYSISSSF